ncbi:UNVERIFIED_CONTAM: hypothetical protein Sradi_6848800 [Sesamum radiatum]|uniref:Reverse transcriptase domain-containing protein n=1 Tax=Sesamum radiatum TaxID=300843 RepID=A0AAW2JNB8_SESRA
MMMPPYRVLTAALLLNLMINAAVWNVRGLNRRDHQVSVTDLITEHCLYFIGLLETRVAVGNVARVQRGLLPHWCYYVDYGGPGNRVWLAWDSNFVDVTIVETGAQFIHCAVCSFSPLVCEHYCSIWGISGGADEFRCCLQDTGLIHVPMHGERFTWHNCSGDARSLWKRLDRLLVNDRWLEQWPDTTYVSLSARTSDHSPLVLRGDTRSRSTGMFRFDNYLARSTEFIPSVRSIWRHHIVGSAMYAVTRKLKALKPIFRAQRQRKDTALRYYIWNFVVNWFRLASRLEQKMLHQRAKMAWLKDGDQCSRIFFRKVAKRRASKRVFQINTADGRPLTSQPEVTNEFIRGTGTPSLSAEIKQAIFDIDETRAPGPDGYSAGFYKAAWPVIGGEVTQAILEFFRTGRLLKQINTTLISLIPKVSNPTVVAEFRPISCCNVLYKAITKILVQRMRSVLDTLISPSQNAFVPGRSIGDNILLAQELFSGYNQKNLPPRCALKVDLRKAYDTVEWDFLKAALTLFGFPERFIQWGDPMSPFLFVLVMEVLTLILLQRIEQNGGFSFHWKCEAIQLFQLSFADDLLLFSKADPSSIQLFKDGLTGFAELSGLQANLQKSNLILSRSAAASRDTLLAILDFQEGHLPLRYLGLPLLASRLSISDCQPILRKIEARIKDWGCDVVICRTGPAHQIRLVCSTGVLGYGIYFAKAHY